MHILNPLYLLGLFGAIVPLILHLIGKRRIRERPFSSLFLLKEIKKSSSIWLRIKDLILLLLRTAILLSLILAFAHPVVQSPIPFIGKEAPKDIVILMDISLSMSARGTFEKARKEVLGIYRDAGRGNNITLLTFSDRIEEERTIKEESELTGFLDGLEVTYRATDIQVALEAGEKKVEKGDGFVKELFIVSDFQKTGLKNLETIYERLEKKKIDLYVSMIEGSTENTYFSSVRVEPPFPLPGLRLKIFPELEIETEGSTHCELFIDNIMKGVKVMDNKEGLISFDMETEQAGYKTGFFRLEGDSLERDNRYFFSFFIPANLAVLVVGEKNKLSFLHTAYSPGIKTPISLTVIEPENLSKTNPSQYDLLILYDVKVNSYIKARTMDYLKKGGGVLVIMGDSFNSEINKTLFDGTRIVKKNHSEKGFFSIKSIDTSFEPLSDFKDKGLKNLSDTKVFQYFSLQSNLRTVIEAKNGEPLMLAGRIHNGNMIIFPFVFDTEWTQLPLKAIFVPLIYRLTFTLAEKREKLPSFIIGETIRLSFDNAGKSPLFILPDGREKLPILAPTGNEFILKDTDIPGIYSFIPSLKDTIPVAVNVSKEESQLERVPYTELKLLIPIIKNSTQVREYPLSGKRWLDLFPLLLTLSLLFLVAELILQNK
jgi:hypothetical protein